MYKSFIRVLYNHLNSFHGLHFRGFASNMWWDFESWSLQRWRRNEWGSWRLESISREVMEVKHAKGQTTSPLCFPFCFLHKGLTVCHNWLEVNGIIL